MRSFLCTKKIHKMGNFFSQKDPEEVAAESSSSEDEEEEDQSTLSLSSSDAEDSPDKQKNKGNKIAGRELPPSKGKEREPHHPLAVVVVGP